MSSKFELIEIPDFVGYILGEKTLEEVLGFCKNESEKVKNTIKEYLDWEKGTLQKEIKNLTTDESPEMDNLSFFLGLLTADHNLELSKDNGVEEIEVFNFNLLDFIYMKIRRDIIIAKYRTEDSKEFIDDLKSASGNENDRREINKTMYLAYRNLFLVPNSYLDELSKAITSDGKEDAEVEINVTK